MKLTWALFELMRLRLAWGLAKKKRRSKRLQFKHRLHQRQKVEKRPFVRPAIASPSAFWYQGFPQHAYTAKARGSRMGKGKGPTKQWYQPVSSGATILKLRHNNLFRLRYVLNQIARCLPGHCRQIFVCGGGPSWHF